MGKMKMKNWKWAVLTFLPFLGAINPWIYLILILTWFIGWVIYWVNNN